MWWVVGVAGVVCAGWSLASVRRILYPEHRPIPPPDPLPSSTPHALTSPDGARFTVWVLEASAPRARILIVHGFYANRLQVLDIAEGLRERGYEAVIVELRGHGDRPGPCTVGVKETEDAVAVLRWARERDGRRPLPVGLLGLSMGAAVACQVALREPAVRAVVVDSVYSRLFPVLVRAIRDRYRLPPVPWAWLTWWTLQLALGCRLSPWDPVSAAPQLRQPLFAIQGGEDRRVAPLLGREFYRRWAGPKERWFEPKVAHVGMFARHPRAYGERVAAFFDRAMR